MRILPNAVSMLCLAGFVMGCSSGYKPYECVIDPADLSPDPQAQWECHRRIMQRAARGKPFTLREFREASEFFRTLTSIDAGALPSEYGPIPPRDLKRRIAEWDRWYEEHRSRLIWDERAGEVRVVDGEPGSAPPDGE